MPKDYTAQEIVSLVTKKRESQAFDELLSQMDADFNLFALDPFTAEEGHQAYTSPKPRNDFMKIYNGINKASLTWQIVTSEEAPQKERDAANMGEEFLTGVIERANKQLRQVGEPPCREGLTWLMCNRGATALKCLIYTNDDNETEIDIRPIDPMRMAWERGVNGLVWAAFLYHISKSEAMDRYGMEVEEEAIVIDFFDTKINAVVFSSGDVKNLSASQFVKEPTPHNLGHVPLWIGMAGGMPTVYDKSDKALLKYQAASVFASARGIYEPRNKQISFLLDSQEKSVAGTLVHEGRTGTPPLKGDPFGAYTVLNMNVDMAETVKALEPPKVPAETAALMGVFEKDMQESTVPYPIGYGLDPQAHSGAALAMLNDNTRSIYDPFCSLLENAYRWLCDEILAQFKTKGQKLTLKGFNQTGKFFTLDANPEEIEDDWYINVKCEPKLPRDEQGELYMALAATNPRGSLQRPFMSNYTAYEKIIKLQNPTAEDKRIEEQMVTQMLEQLPQIQIRKMAKALIDKGDIEGAKEVLASLPTPGGSQPGGMGQPGGMPGGAMPGGMPMPTPQELPQLLAMAEQLLAQGKPLPPELEAVIRGLQGK